MRLDCQVPSGLCLQMARVIDDELGRVSRGSGFEVLVGV